MILIYNEARALFFGNNNLIPGTNIVPDSFDLKHPTIAEMLEDGRLEKVEPEKRAVERAFTKKTLDGLAALAKDKAVKDAAKARKKDLEAIDREWNEGFETEKKDSAE